MRIVQSYRAHANKLKGRNRNRWKRRNNFEKLNKHFKMSFNSATDHYQDMFQYGYSTHNHHYISGKLYIWLLANDYQIYFQLFLFSWYLQHVHYTSHWIYNKIKTVKTFKYYLLLENKLFYEYIHWQLKKIVTEYSLDRAYLK